VFAPEYRRVPEANAIEEIGDIFAAFSFVSGALEKYGGDPERVAVASESAGSFLSIYAVAATVSPVLREALGLPTAPSLHVRTIACFSGMFYTARKDSVGLLYARNIYGEKKKDSSFMKLMNPECHEVMNCLPPVFLVGSDADFLKGYTKRYAEALRQAEHPCKLVYYTNNKTLTHAFPALKPELPESSDVLDKLVDWVLRKHHTGTRAQEVIKQRYDINDHR
jgi:acetyl esterase